MPTLQIALGIAGVVLILVGAVGGGFVLSSISIPTVGVFPRVVSLVVGSALVLFAVLVDLGHAEADASKPSPSPSTAPVPQGTTAPAPTSERSAPSSATPHTDSVPVTAPIVAGTGYTVNLFADSSLSASVLEQLPDGYLVSIICTTQGDAVTSDLTGVTSSLWNGVSAGGVLGFVPDVYTGTPTYQPVMPNCNDTGNNSPVLLSN
jgi:hypothetical protein